MALVVQNGEMLVTDGSKIIHHGTVQKASFLTMCTVESLNYMLGCFFVKTVAMCQLNYECQRVCKDLKCD